MEKARSAGRIVLSIRFVLLMITVAYTLAYLAHPATPGNNPGQHPLGWWGWFDQGQYLLAANSIAEKNFTPEKHYYPPLYPAIGALFSKWSSGHMYFLLNLGALLWFVFVFIRFSDRYFPRWFSLFLFLGTSIIDIRIFQNYIIPWTTTLGTFFIATGILGLIWMKEVREGRRSGITSLQTFIVAAGLSLLLPTRPVDAAVGFILGLGFLYYYWVILRETPNKVPGPIKFSSLIIAGISLGPVIFFGFNTLVFGSFMGGYLHHNENNGFFPADLAEKFVSIWLDGFLLYGVSGTGLTHKLPWLLVSLAGLVWAFIQGSSLLRILGLSISMLFILYLPYGDLLPNGLWHFLNIHYFKWTLPFLALMGALLVAHTWQAWRMKQSRILPTATLIGIPLLLLSLHLTLDISPIDAGPSETFKQLKLDLKNAPIDFIDIKGMTGPFHNIYFGGHKLMIDGAPLRHVRDFRVLPMASGIRVLFIRPVQGHSLIFIPDAQLNCSDKGAFETRIGTYGFSLGIQ
jgi:hypothetical protein